MLDPFDQNRRAHYQNEGLFLRINNDNFNLGLRGRAIHRGFELSNEDEDEVPNELFQNMFENQHRVNADIPDEVNPFQVANNN